MLYYEVSLKERMEEKDREVLEAIKKLMAKTNHSPSFLEISKEAGIKSKSTTLLYLRRLRAQGYVDWVPKTPRTLRVLKQNYESDLNKGMR